MKWGRSTDVFLPNAPTCWPTDGAKAARTVKAEFAVPRTGVCSFLSSGELGLSDKLAENGLKSRGGRGSAFHGAACGLVHAHQPAWSSPDAGAVANRIKLLASEHYGHAGHDFSAEATKVETLNAVRAEIGPAMADAVRHLVPEGADGQVRRVAMRFALCGMAGMLALRLGILPEKAGRIELHRNLLPGRLTARGGTGLPRIPPSLSTVRLFIERHGASHIFQDLDTQNVHLHQPGGISAYSQRHDRVSDFAGKFQIRSCQWLLERRAIKSPFREAHWLQTERPGRFKSRRTLFQAWGVRVLRSCVLPQEETAS